MSSRRWPRCPIRGLAAVLAVAVCAALAGARTYTTITEWAHDLPVGVRVRLGLVGRVAPSESTIRRVLQAIDAEALDTALSAWLIIRSAPTTGGPVPDRRLIALDGKSARGARGPDGRAVHLLAALDDATGVVLGQTVVQGKTNEINAFAPLTSRCRSSTRPPLTVHVRRHDPRGAAAFVPYLRRSSAAAGVRIRDDRDRGRRACAEVIYPAHCRHE